MEKTVNSVLNKMLIDAKKNRSIEDPHGLNSEWAGYISGIKGAMYRLEMEKLPYKKPAKTIDTRKRIA